MRGEGCLKLVKLQSEYCRRGETVQSLAPFVHHSQRMDRFEYTSLPVADVRSRGKVLAEASGIRLYDGDHRTQFEEGSLLLTAWRLYYADSKASLCLPLQRISHTKCARGGERDRRQLHVILLLQLCRQAHVEHRQRQD
jgi:hypothetical protein